LLSFEQRAALLAAAAVDHRSFPGPNFLECDPPGCCRGVVFQGVRPKIKDNAVDTCIAECIAIATAALRRLACSRVLHIYRALFFPPRPDVQYIRAALHALLTVSG
jgi:hypothetical protein